MKLMPRMKNRALCLAAFAAAACGSNAAGIRVRLPDGSAGIGFDDLRYSSSLKRVLVPGGRSGMLDLVDPDTLAVQSIGGFGSVSSYSGSHDDGPTSVVFTGHRGRRKPWLPDRGMLRRNGLRLGPPTRRSALVHARPGLRLRCHRLQPEPRPRLPGWEQLQLPHHPGPVRSGRAELSRPLAGIRRHSLRDGG